MVKDLVLVDGDLFTDSGLVALKLDTRVGDILDRDSQPPCAALCVKALDDEDNEILFVLNETHLHAIKAWIEDYFDHKKLEPLGLENR